MQGFFKGLHRIAVTALEEPRGSEIGVHLSAGFDLQSALQNASRLVVTIKHVINRAEVFQHPNIIRSGPERLLPGAGSFLIARVAVKKSSELSRWKPFCRRQGN